jgi:hypothetical protein
MSATYDEMAEVLLRLARERPGTPIDSDRKALWMREVGRYYPVEVIDATATRWLADNPGFPELHEFIDLANKVKRDLPPPRPSEPVGVTPPRPRNDPRAMRSGKENARRAREALEWAETQPAVDGEQRGKLALDRFRQT